MTRNLKPTVESLATGASRSPAHTLREIAENPCAACDVRDLSVCSALEIKDLHRLDGILSLVRVGTGQMVFFEGDPAEHLFVLTDGCIKLYKLLADGRRQITGFLLPSDFLGLAMRAQYAYTAEAVVRSSLCRFPKTKLEALMEEFPALEKRLLGVASNELASAQDQMLLLGRKTAQEKLASFLHTLSLRAVARGAAADRIDLPMGRADIADYLGLTVETVSRCFTRLRKQKMIDFMTPQMVMIRDPGEISVLAGVDEFL